MSTDHTIVIKVGSNLLANTEHLTPRFAFMHTLMGDIARLRDSGIQVVLATSGSVALGLKTMRMDPSGAGVQEKQAAAACGQPILMNAYKQIGFEYGIDIAQVLVTLEDLEEHRRFLNTKNTLHRLLERGILPIVNENDTVTTEEIRVGDNDRLAAKVAQMVQARHLVILTVVDGLYDRNPAEEGARLVETVEDVSAYLGVTSGTNLLGSGGMRTKMQAANMAQNAGCTTLIGHGEHERPVTSLLNSERPHTRCPARKTPQSAWAVWLTDRLHMAGSVVMRQSAADDLQAFGSPVECRDVLAVQGDFAKADVLHVYDEAGLERARGMTNFSSDEMRLLLRTPPEEISHILGYTVQPTLINAKNLVVLSEHHLPWAQPEHDSGEETGPTGVLPTPALVY